jgi:hypothetical protein
MFVFSLMDYKYNHSFYFVQKSFPEILTGHDLDQDKTVLYHQIYKKNPTRKKSKGEKAEHGTHNKAAKTRI